MMDTPEKAAGQSRTPEDEAWEAARHLRNRAQYEAALDRYRDYSASYPDDRRASMAGSNVLICLSRLKRWADLERHALGQIGGDRAAFAYQYLGEAQLQLGRAAEAVLALETAVKLDPELTEARNLLAAARGGSAPASTGRWRSWPSRDAQFQDVEKLIRTYVLKSHPAPRFIDRDIVFMTLGSCFADNLAKRLRLAGYTVNSESIGEEVNSTFANRALLDWIEKGDASPAGAVMEQCYGASTRARMQHAVTAADVVVLTLGVAPTFFSRETGEFAFMHARTPTSKEFFQRANEMRMTTVEENVANVTHIINAIGRLTGGRAKVVLTVSPVPLGATNESPSALIADCISKSTLRVACDQVIRAMKGEVLYWPSFEIVKWLGPSLPRPAFGEEDGNTRHVSAWLVALIIDLFITWYSAEERTEAVT